MSIDLVEFHYLNADDLCLIFYPFIDTTLLIRVAIDPNISKDLCPSQKKKKLIIIIIIKYIYIYIFLRINKIKIFAVEKKKIRHINIVFCIMHSML